MTFIVVYFRASFVDLDNKVMQAYQMWCKNYFSNVYRCYLLHAYQNVHNIRCFVVTAFENVVKVCALFLKSEYESAEDFATLVDKPVLLLLFAHTIKNSGLNYHFPVKWIICCFTFTLLTTFFLFSLSLFLWMFGFESFLI